MRNQFPLYAGRYKNLATTAKPKPKDDKTPQVHEGYKLLKLKQQQFCKDDGLPIFLKRPSDKLLFNTTVSLCILGFCMTLKMVYDMSVKKE